MDVLSTDVGHSDDFWIEMLKLQNKRLLDGRAVCSFLEKDQREHEVSKADVMLVLTHVWRSYDDPEQTWIWSHVMFAAAGSGLVPLIGAKSGIAFALFAPSLWSCSSAT